MSRTHAWAFLLFACIAGATNAGAQQSVYIGQVDPNVVPQVDPRVAQAARGNGRSAGDQILLNTSGSTLLPTQQSFVPSTGAGLQGVVSSAGQAGSLSPGVTNNIAVINQAGSGNLGTITQTGANNLATSTVQGNNNATTQTQDGLSNRSSIGIAGNGNAITTSQTGGNGNTSAIDVSGSGYIINNTQAGSGLAYGLSVTSTTVSDKIITIDQRNGLVPSTGSTSGLSIGARGVTVSTPAR